MQKELLEFLHGERNAVRGDLVLGRERAGNSEYYYVSAPQHDDECKPILKGWAKKVKRDVVALERDGQFSVEVKKPKHTGGKRPFIMLMQDRGEVIEKLSLSASGFLFQLFCGGYVEWHSGRVIDRRNKKPLTVKMICDKFKIKQADMQAILRELGESGIMKYDRKNRAYFINCDIAKKGGAGSENKI